MKKCPVCKSNIFDDMDTCYNCLHKFEMEEQIDTKTSVSDFVRVGSAIDVSDFLNEYHKFLGSYINRNKSKEVV